MGCGSSQRLSLHRAPLAASLCVVNWLHRIVAIVMLAAWMPAASLCLAECAGVVERGDCCADESGGKPDAAASHCCFLSSSLYKSHDSQTLVTAPDALATAQLPSPVSIAPLPSRLASLPPALSPPDFPVTWQFTFRTALPPRAPSLAS
jgi:hypothetical protein